MPRYDSRFVRGGLLCASLLGTFTLAATAQHSSRTPAGASSPAAKKQVANAPLTPQELLAKSWSAHVPKGALLLQDEGGIAGCPPQGCTDTEGEPEDCPADGTDDFNGGCNSPVPAFSPLAVGQTVCGQTGTFAGDTLRDTDWYQFTLTAPATLTWTAVGDFNIQVGFIPSDPVTPCPQGSFIVQSSAGPCTPATVTNAFAAGTYVAFISTLVVTPCTAQYAATLQVAGPPAPTGGCCLSAGCTLATAVNCGLIGGQYAGDGTACPGYVPAACANALEDISGTGTLAPLSSNCDDCSDPSIPIGFSFPFYGNNFTTIRVSSNGFATFDPAGGNPFTNTPLPNSATPNNMIAPFWDDFRTDAVGDIFTQTLASPQRFIIQWNNVELFSAPGGSNTFQAILFATGEIQYRYGSLQGSPPMSGTIGVENATGTVGTNIDGATVGTGNTCISLTFSTVDPCIAGGCDEDVDGDNEVEVDDLIAVILQWGCVGAGCTADVNNSGVVDVDDLIAVILAWGAC